MYANDQIRIAVDLDPQAAFELVGCQHHACVACGRRKITGRPTVALSSPTHREAAWAAASLRRKSKVLPSIRECGRLLDGVSLERCFTCQNPSRLAVHGCRLLAATLAFAPTARWWRRSLRRFVERHPLELAASTAFAAMLKSSSQSDHRGIAPVLATRHYKPTTSRERLFPSEGQ